MRDLEGRRETGDRVNREGQSGTEGTWRDRAGQSENERSSRRNGLRPCRAWRISMAAAGRSWFVGGGAEVSPEFRGGWIWSRGHCP